MQSLPAVTTLASCVLDISVDNVANKDLDDQFSALFHVCFWETFVLHAFSLNCYQYYEGHPKSFWP